ncbi:MAG: cytochrome c biogenesis protein CcsA [Candidatus Dactylopiibacterium sp.]|nr:cytochrome c biogenesis protein CcsA [Candidatus Dactylopiibacterium sp.]
MAPILLHLLPASFYLALAAAGPRLGRARHPASRHVVAGLLCAALILHGFVLAQDMFEAGGFRFGLSIAMSLSLWLAMLVYGIESVVNPLRPLLTYAAPIAALFALLPAIVPGHPQVIEAPNWAFRLHIAVAMAAYSLFTLAVFHALLMAAAERRLHSATLFDTGDLPPLLSLERILFRLITTAFVFLTLTVGSGVLFSDQIFGKPFGFSHKAVFGVASWVLFGILLTGRTVHGWRGKTATRWLLAGFICLVLAYAGTRFVLEFLLQRSA